MLHETWAMVCSKRDGMVVLFKDSIALRNLECDVYEEHLEAACLLALLSTIEPKDPTAVKNLVRHGLLARTKRAVTPALTGYGLLRAPVPPPPIPAARAGIRP